MISLGSKVLLYIVITTLICFYTNLLKSYLLKKRYPEFEERYEFLLDYKNNIKLLIESINPSLKDKVEVSLDKEECLEQYKRSKENPCMNILITLKDSLIPFKRIVYLILSIATIKILLKKEEN